MKKSFFFRFIFFKVGVYSYEANAFKFGDGPFSHSLINIPIRHLWQNSFNIQFDFRTFYPNGVLFLAPVSAINHQPF